MFSIKCFLLALSHLFWVSSDQEIFLNYIVEKRIGLNILRNEHDRNVPNFIFVLGSDFVWLLHGF